MLSCSCWSAPHHSSLLCSHGGRQQRIICYSTHSEDLYSILSVPATATQAEIKTAYRRLVHDLHPDKHAHKQGQAATADAFLRCKVAYEVLSDDEQRRQYDESLAAAAAAAGAYTTTQQGATEQQPWSPYNSWMDAYASTNTNAAQQPHPHGSDPSAAASADYYESLQQAAAATAAAGASSSGLSDYRDPLLAAAAAGSGSGEDAPNTQQQTSAAVRAALLDQHGLTLEQFGSLQDAMAALAEREQQQAVVGLAEGDYDDDAWHMYHSTE